MASANDFTHEEIWDDSALVESWNQALDEYKKYHSIHAKGGSVEDIPKQLVPTQPEDAKPETSRGSQAPDAEGAHEDAMHHETIAPSQGQPTTQEHRTGPEPAAAYPSPQVLLGSVEDEELKKLLMSWYWAGYYTATYQAKQKQTQQGGSEQ